jgi:hypothetical protein
MLKLLTGQSSQISLVASPTRLTSIQILPARLRDYVSVGESLDPEAHALVPQGHGLAHGLGELWLSVMGAMGEGRHQGTKAVDACHMLPYEFRYPLDLMR